jgi:transposase-like protein
LIKCPNCGSLDTRKKGFAFNLNDKKQRYQCRRCKRKFSESEVADERLPKILTMDIETLPILGYAWAAYDTNIVRVKKDWCVATWSAKWWSDPRVMSDAMTIKETGTRDDRRICASLWKLFDSADIIIGQNSKQFDFKKMNTRWWFHRMGPPSSYKAIDTLETARRAFSMTFNNLDYLASYLGIGRKKETGGIDLWDDFESGDKNARARMVEYCCNDTVLCERVYDTMKPWVYNHPKLSVYQKIKDICPVCLSKRIAEIGYYQAAVQRYKEWRCGDCQSVFHSTKAEK